MMSGQVIELAARPRRQTRTPAQTRAVTLAMSHTGFVRVLELGIALLEGEDGALSELFATLQSSITAGDSPELHDAVIAMGRRRLAAADA